MLADIKWQKKSIWQSTFFVNNRNQLAKLRRCAMRKPGTLPKIQFGIIKFGDDGDLLGDGGD